MKKFITFFTRKNSGSDLPAHQRQMLADSARREHETNHMRHVQYSNVAQFNALR